MLINIKFKNPNWHEAHQLDIYKAQPWCHSGFGPPGPNPLADMDPHCSMLECWDDMVQYELCEERLHMSCEGFKTAPEGELICIVCRLPDSGRLRNYKGVISDPSTVNNR